jgi:predicted HD phosphohydrolase
MGTHRVFGDGTGADAVALRRWDDAGKVDGAVVAGIASYEPLLRSLVCSGS